MDDRQLNLLDDSTTHTADDEVGEAFVPQFAFGPPNPNHTMVTRINLPYDVTVEMRTEIDGQDLETEVTVEGTPSDHEEYQAILGLITAILT